ncbi:MAG: [FeFe] hydrogenase H-cluster maturation GTPase HydF, partial [Treponema sp.]|nr:[FeFe] hydrogenase H-cluster maturation GTPase HydF [Treponema sp.]
MLERITISFFGKTNAGKSSLINAVTGQDVSIVSEIPGTTTDPVKKVMELLPLGPVTLIDTPGLDDKSLLAEERIKKTEGILDSTQIAILVADGRQKNFSLEKELILKFNKKNIPFLFVVNKKDLIEEKNDEGSAFFSLSENPLFVSAKNKTNIEELKKKLGELYTELSEKKEKKLLVRDLLDEREGQTVILVIPIDQSAPKDRLILPQQMVLRELIGYGMIPLCSTPKNLPSALKSLSKVPSLVITDSQAFAEVSNLISPEIPLTSFSILMARYKGTLEDSLLGSKALDSIKSGDKILISEGCTHHRQCGDIGSVKLPALIRSYSKSEPLFEFSSGATFPRDLSSYSLVIHCGGCMLNENEMANRARLAKEGGIPFTNYGMAIAKMRGILERSLLPLKISLE